jgi:outer membrane protein TolC
MKTASIARLMIALTWLAGSSLPVAMAQPAQIPVTSASAIPAAADDDLTQVLQTIAARSPDVLAAQAAQRQTQAQVGQARAAWFGKVDAYALSQHFNDPRLVRPITQPPNVALYPFASNQFGYGLDFQLPIDVSRQIAAEVDAARSRASGAQWSAEDVRLRALLQGATLYRNLQTLAGQHAALDKQLSALQISERVARTGLKVGNIARVNLLRVQAAIAEIEASIANLQGQERKLRAQLAALMGVADFSVPIDPPVTGPAAFPVNPDTVPPSVQAAQSAVLASQAKVEAAQRAQYPQMAVNGGWNRNAIQWDSRAVDTWQINLGVRLNLWSGGAQRSAIDATQAAQDEARHRLQGAQDNLRATREGAVALWNAQDLAYRAAQSGLLSAEESARIEQDRFRIGLGSATDLIDAEAALTRARASVAGALSGWWQADDALRYAYGEPPLALHTAMQPSHLSYPMQP